MCTVKEVGRERERERERERFKTYIGKSVETILSRVKTVVCLS